MTELQVMLEGVFEPSRFLALVRDFIVFEGNGGGALVKKMAGYHQFSCGSTLCRERDAPSGGAATRRGTGLPKEGDGPYEAESANRVGRPGDHRIGVVWHTQGFRQEPDHGLLHRGHHPRACHGEPDGCRPHGPQRPGRPTLRHLLALPGAAAPAAGAGGEPSRPAQASSR